MVTLTAWGELDASATSCPTAMHQLVEVHESEGRYASLTCVPKIGQVEWCGGLYFLAVPREGNELCCATDDYAQCLRGTSNGECIEPWVRTLSRERNHVWRRTIRIPFG